MMFEGHEIVPIQFLKALLPDPATLGWQINDNPVLVD